MRECSECGADISHKRRNAVVCSESCRRAWKKANSREAWVASDPRCRQCGVSIAHKKTRSFYCGARCRSNFVGNRWRRENRGHWEEYWSQYYARTRDQKIAYAREWYRENAAKAAEVNKAWREANPECRRQDSSRRRATIRSASVHEVTRRDIRRILNANEGRCTYCNSAQSEHVDHIVPLARGGSHSVGNLTGACAGCNLSKHDKFVAEWRRDTARGGGSHFTPRH